MDGHEKRLEEALGACLESLGRGEELTLREAAARYPDLADELLTFFAADELVTRLTDPLRNDDLPVPTVAGYELLAVLGRGGMGVVYKARQLPMNRIVAVKMIRAGQFATAREKQRFRTEAELLSQFDHSNIVPVYDVGESGGLLYLSMKLLEGQTLAASVKSSVFGPQEAARILLDVARAMDYAHQRGILHRDLKPSNIQLDASGRPYVCDFGLAKRVSGEGELTQTGAILGSLDFMAPEAARGCPAMAATDVYGLGGIL